MVHGVRLFTVGDDDVIMFMVVMVIICELVSHTSTPQYLAKMDRDPYEDLLNATMNASLQSRELFDEQ